MLQKKGNINWDRTGKDIGKHKEGNNQHKALLAQSSNNMIKDMKRLPNIETNGQPEPTCDVHL